MYPALQRVDENSVTSGRFYLFIGGSWLHFSHSPLYLSLSLSFYSSNFVHSRRTWPAFKSPENATDSMARSLVTSITSLYLYRVGITEMK